MRQECEKLEGQLKKMDVTKSPAAARALETQLASTRQQMIGLITEAAKAGAMMEHDFKDGIYNASQTVNNLTANITSQRGVIRQLQNELSLLKEKYRETVKSGGDTTGMSEHIKAQTAKLREQKDILFGLTQQQAEARLSVKRLKDEYAAFKEEAGETVEANEKMSISLTKVLGAIGGVTALKNFITELVNVRGQFQQLEIAFTTMLKSKEKADKLMAELVDIAAKTPFDLQGVASSAKQMLAYGSSAENVGDELVMLGNVAAGVGSQLSEIAYLYGTLRTQGRAYAVDIRQFAGRGIPIYEELAKVLGVTKDKVSELVKEGKVGFKEVEQAFKNMTSEFGIYYNLMEEQSKSLTGQLSNLGDAWDTMLNEIGKSTQGVASAGISGIKILIENYEIIGKILVGLIATYGTYKTSLFVVKIAQDTLTARMQLAILVTKAQMLAQTAFNTVMKANPYVLVATALAGVVTAMWAFHDSTNAAEKAQQKFNEEQKRFVDQEEGRKQKIDELIRIIQDETETEYSKIKAYEELQRYSPALTFAYTREQLAVLNLAAANKELNKERDKNSYENIIKNIQQWEDKIKLLKASMKNAGQGAPLIASQIESAKASLNQWKSAMNEYNRLKREVEENSKPIEVKLMEAESNREQIVQEYNVARQALQEVQEKLKNTPFSQIPFEIQLRFNNIQKAMHESDNLIAGLKSEQNKSEKSYKDAYNEAKKEYEAKLKAVKDAKKGTEKEYKKAVEELEDAEKKYKALGGITGSSLSKQENQAKKEAEQRKKEQQQIVDELLQLRRNNQQDEINLMKEGAEKKRRQIELDYRKEIDAYNRAKAKYGETDEVKDMKSNADSKRKKFLYDVDVEVLQAEKDALNSYLQEYGTFQQRKYAIAQEYAGRIAKAQSDAERMQLGRERDSKLSGLESEALKANIDWITVFGEFGGMFSDMIKPALEYARKFMKTGEFKNSDASSQKVMVDAVNQMEQVLGNSGGLDFKKLGEDVQAYRYAVISLNLAKKQEAEALERLVKAQEDYENALKSGSDEQKNAAKEALANAQSNADATSANVQMQSQNMENAQRGMSDTASRLKTNMDNVTQGLQKMASGGLTSLYEGLLQAGKGIGGAAAKVADSIEDVPVVGWIISIIDVFKDGLSDVVGGLLDAVFNAVSGIIDDIFSGDLFVSIGESLLSGIGKIFDAITWGGFGSWFNSGDSDENLKGDIERLTQSNQDLKVALDNLAEKMEDSAVADAPELYEQQKENIKQAMANTQEMMRRSGAAYSNGFLGIGGTHSSNKRINDAMSVEDWERISRVTGVTVRNAGDFWNLTSEQMGMVADGATDLYSKIKQYADDGHENAAQYMDEYVSYYKQLEELDNAYREKLTSVSFDTVRNDFKSILLDMESDADDFAASFERMMQEAIIESMVSDIYATKLKQWYGNFAGSMKDDGTISKNEQENLKKEWDEIVKNALEERNSLFESMGWGSISEQQSATSKGFETMSQDSADELNGRFTAVYESNLRMESAVQQQSVAITEIKGSISELVTQSSTMCNIADETRTILANSYLELQQIRENTGEIIKPIKRMQLDIAEVKRNTAKL